MYYVRYYTGSRKLQHGVSLPGQIFQQRLSAVATANKREKLLTQELLTPA
jgi:hypothetical protein